MQCRNTNFQNKVLEQLLLHKVWFISNNITLVETRALFSPIFEQWRHLLLALQLGKYTALTNP
jgi:hypothetical protein